MSDTHPDLEGHLYGLFYCLQLAFFWTACLLPPLQVYAQQEAPSIILVASPQLKSPLFKESVVLVSRHGRSRPFGVILNKPAGIRLTSPGTSDGETLIQRPLFLGGPISQQNIVLLFKEPALLQDQSRLLSLGSGIFMGMGLGLYNELAPSKSEADLKVFSGISSWGHGQLEDEIARGDWWVLPYDANVAMRLDTSNMWQELLALASKFSL